MIMLRDGQRKFSLHFRVIACLVILCFTSTLIILPQNAYAQSLPAVQAGVLNLPVPGAMVSRSPGFVPAFLKGMAIHPENPFQIDFIVDKGNSGLNNETLKAESTKLIKYFLSSLTIPEDDLWVNLSPYEKDRIIPHEFGMTEMGRDMLAQDYLIKQLTSSLIYPEGELGTQFWDRVYRKAYDLYGTTNIPVNTFNKVWILPDKAVVYEHEQTAIVIDGHLRVMLESDYFALQESLNNKVIGTDELDKGNAEFFNDIASGILREVILPEIEKEVNKGKNFALLRQIFQSMILATWYKKKLRNSLLNKVYADQKKVPGVDVEDKEIKQKIYEQYLDAFKVGAFNYIKADQDPFTQQIISRQYFSGGLEMNVLKVLEQVDAGTYQLELSDVTPTDPDTSYELNRTNLLPVNVDRLQVMWEVLKEIASKAMGRRVSEEEFNDKEVMEIVAEYFVDKGYAEEISDPRNIVDINIVKRRLPEGVSFEPEGKITVVKIKEGEAQKNPLVGAFQRLFVNINGEAVQGINFLTTPKVTSKWQNKGLIIIFENEWDNNKEARQHEYLELGLMLSNPDGFNRSENPDDWWADSHDITVEIMSVGQEIDRDRLSKYKGTIGAGIGSFLRRDKKSGQIQKLIEGIQKLEGEYRDAIMRINEPKAGSFQESYSILRTTESRFERLKKAIGKYTKEGQLRGTLFQQIFESYDAEIETINSQNRNLLVIYTALIWPQQKRREKEFQYLQKEAQSIWLQWQKDFEKEETGGHLQDYVQGLLEAKRQVAEASNFGQKRKAYKSLRERIVGGLKSQVIGGLYHRVFQRFEINLLTQIYLSLREADSQTAKKWRQVFGLVRDVPAETVKEAVSSSVYGYNPSLKKDVRKDLYDTVFKKIGADLKRVVQKKRRGSSLKLSATVVAVAAIFGLGQLFVFGPSKSERVDTADYRSNQEAGRQKISQEGQVESVMPVKEVAVEKKAEPFQIALVLDQPLMTGNTKTESEEGKPEAELSEDVLQQIALLESQIQGQQQRLAELGENEYQVAEEVKGLQEKAAQQFQEFRRTAQTLKPMKPKQKPFVEPEKWYEPKGTMGGTAGDVRELEQSEDLKVDLVEAESSELQLGGGNPEYGEVISKVQGNYSYLLGTQYNIMTVNGKLIPTARDFKTWVISSGQKSFAEFVVTPSKGRKQVHALIPPGYVVSGVLTEKTNVKEYRVVRDQKSGTWIIGFDKNPGLVKIGVRPAENGELENVSQMMFVDDLGRMMTRTEVEKSLRTLIPAKVRHIVDKARTLSIQDRVKIIGEIQGLFDYTTNPLLEQKNQPRLETLFKNYAGECSGLTMVRAVISYLSEIPAAIQEGYMSTGETVYGGSAHHWQWTNDGVKDSTEYVREVSPLWGKQGVTKSDWQQEMNVLTSNERMVWIDRELDLIALGLGKKSLENDLREIQRRKEALQKGEDIEKTKQEDPEKELAYYSNLRVHYGNELDKLEQASFSLEQIEGVAGQIYSIDLTSVDNKFQLMAYGHYLFGALNALLEKLETIHSSPGKDWQDMTKRVEEMITLLDQQDKAQHLISFAKNLKGILSTEISATSQSRDWLLVEPIKDIEAYRGVVFSGSKKVTSDYFLTYYDDKTPEQVSSDPSAVFTDYLTGHEITIPDLLATTTDKLRSKHRPYLLDHINGLWAFVSRGVISFGGPRAGDYANYRIKRIVDDFPILRMNFYDYPFPDGEWLAYAYTDNYIWYYGPVAKRLGIEGQMFKMANRHEHNITHIHNKIVIKLDDGASVYFVGEGAQWLGLEGKLFERADLPIELENGNIIHKVSSDQDYIEIMVYRFNNSTSPLIPQGESFIKIKRSLHYENEIRIFSQSRWAVNNVYYENGVGFAGELNDPDLEAVRVKSWTDLGTIREAPDGRLFVRITAYDPQKNRYFDEMKGAWAQNAGEYIKYKNSSTYAYFANADLTKEAFLVALTPIFFTSDQWVMKVITTGGERWIVTSNILLKYFDNSRLDHVFTILKVYRTKDGRWLARVKYENTEERYIGPLVAELPELRYAYGEEVEGLDLPEIYEKSLVQVAFTRNEDGTIDPEQYAVTYNYKNEEGVMVCKCLGPLAEAFGKDKIDFSGSVEFGHTVNGDVIVDSYMSGSVLSLNSWNYLSRTAAMYGIDQPEGSGVIPQRRIDLRWANFYSRFLKHKQGFESIRRGWEIVELIKEFRSLAAYMKNNISARYFDVKAVEEVVREVFLGKSEESKKWLTGDIISDVKETLMIYGLEHLLVEMLISIHDLGLDEQIVRGLFDNQEWSRIIGKYVRGLRKGYGLPEDIFKMNFDWNEKARNMMAKLDNYAVSLTEPDQQFQDNLKEYKDRTRALEIIENIIAKNDPLARRVLRELNAADIDGHIRYFHGHIDNKISFDVEVGREARNSTAYQLISLLRAGPSEFKVGWEKFDGYQERYEKWQNMNADLNEFLGEEFDGDKDVNIIIEGIYEILHDVPALLLLIMTTIIASNLALLRFDKKDRQSGLSTEEIIEEIWRSNPWFSGENQGEDVGAADLLKQIMVAGKSMDDTEKKLLKEIHEGLDERGKMIVDAILLLALDSPEPEMKVSASKLTGLLVPYFGAALVRDRPNFQKRQAMNQELLDFIQDVDLKVSFLGFYDGLLGIVDGYGLVDDQVLQEGHQAFLEPAAFGQRIKEQMRLGHKVIVHGPKRSGRHVSGVSTIRPQIEGGEFDEVREYQQGDPISRINWPLTARANKTMVNQLKQDAETAATIVIDMRSLEKTNMDSWIRDLVNSIKALYGKLRVGNGQTDYALDGLVFLLPGGRIDVMKRQELYRQQLGIHGFYSRIIQKVEEQYQSVYRKMKQKKPVKALNFYDNERNKRYEQRTEDVGYGLGEERSLKEQLQAEFGRSKPSTIFIAGTNSSEEQRKIAEQLIPSLTYAWDKDQARLIDGFLRRKSRNAPLDTGTSNSRKVTVDMAMKSDAKQIRSGKEAGNNRKGIVEPQAGGIDLNAVWLELETKGQSADFDVLLNINSLTPRNLKIEGLTPFIFQTIPLPSLHLILGQTDLEEQKYVMELIN